jgi:hypothetical protein
MYGFFSGWCSVWWEKPCLFGLKCGDVHERQKPNHWDHQTNRGMQRAGHWPNSHTMRPSPIAKTTSLLTSHAIHITIQLSTFPNLTHGASRWPRRARNSANLRGCTGGLVKCARVNGRHWHTSLCRSSGKHRTMATMPSSHASSQRHASMRPGFHTELVRLCIPISPQLFSLIFLSFAATSLFLLKTLKTPKTNQKPKCAMLWFVVKRKICSKKLIE